MARKRRKQIHHEAVESTGLAAPYPAGPTPQPRVVLYCRYPYNAHPNPPVGAPPARSFVWTFNADYAAKKFVDTIIGDSKFKWLRADQILTARNILIETRDLQAEGGRRNSDLERVVEHEYTDAEAAWQIGVPDSLYLETFLRPFDQMPILKQPAAEGKTRQSPPRASREGLVTVGMICDELGIDARDGRSALRRQRVEQPEAGWAWPAKQAAKIKAMIEKACR